MKKNISIGLLTAAAATLLVAPPMSYAQPVKFLETPANKAFAASPRAKEVYPWLTRSMVVRGDRTSTGSEISIVKRHRSLASSPRALELYPELTRSQPAHPRSDTFVRARANPMLRTSPRAREEWSAYAGGIIPRPDKHLPGSRN